VQGGRSILDEYADRVVSVFLFPPSWEELEIRLRGRGTDDESAIQTRLANARSEVEHAGLYEYWLVNDEIDAARARLEAILSSESLRRHRWPEPPLG